MPPGTNADENGREFPVMSDTPTQNSASKHEENQQRNITLSDAALAAHTAKETSMAVLIALVLAFIFRGFVVEAFVIPTGSMAPTLLGSHMRFTAPSSGYSWAVGPWDVQPDGVTPLSIQGGPSRAHGGEFETGTLVDEPLTPEGMIASMEGAVVVHDPMTGEPVYGRGVPTRWGDRIFVLKYLYSLFDPARWDVVVFRNPRQPTMNYIKRLIGLPGEMVAIVDGDVFIRKAHLDDPPASRVNPWSLPGWKIQRKSSQAQAVMWQRMYSSQFAPLESLRNDGSRWFMSPWVPIGTGTDGKAWDFENREMIYRGGNYTTRLAWNVRERPISDSYAYNETPRRASLEYPVSDVRLSAGITPLASKGRLDRVSAYVEARGHTFRGDIDAVNGIAQVRMGTGEGKQLDYVTLASVNISKSLLAPGTTPVHIAFSHVDQSLTLSINGKEVVSAEYDWDIAERVEYSLAGNLDDVSKGPEFLTIDSNYKRPQVWFELQSSGPSSENGLAVLRDVALDRDVHYQADIYRYQAEDGPSHSRARTPALATHPSSTLTLGDDEFFVCGDNSPQSLDGRLWDVPHPLVAKIDSNPGVVHRDLLIGKAFLVYLPAPAKAGKVVLPDLGRTRFIR